MLRKHKQFSFPRKLFDKARIVDENKLQAKYGLKNKREIWKTDAKVKYFRTRAKGLLEAPQEEQQKFFDKLNALGLKVETVTDVLALHLEDLLKRRLASIMVEKKLAFTPKHARQMIVHKKVMIDGVVVNVPSYLVRLDEESKITLKKKVKKAPEPAAEEPATEEAETPAEENKEESKPEETAE